MSLECLDGAGIPRSTSPELRSTTTPPHDHHIPTDLRSLFRRLCCFVPCTSHLGIVAGGCGDRADVAGVWNFTLFIQFTSFNPHQLSMEFKTSLLRCEHRYGIVNRLSRSCAEKIQGKQISYNLPPSCHTNSRIHRINSEKAIFRCTVTVRQPVTGSMLHKTCEVCLYFRRLQFVLQVTGKGFSMLG